MSLLSDIKHFLKKHFKNPTVLIGVAYLIYRIMTKKSNKEFFAESIKVIEENDKYDIIFDDSLQKFILIDKSTQDIFSSDEESDIKKFTTSKYGGN